MVSIRHPCLLPLAGFPPLLPGSTPASHLPTHFSNIKPRVGATAFVMSSFIKAQST